MGQKGYRGHQGASGGIGTPRWCRGPFGALQGVGVYWGGWQGL